MRVRGMVAGGVVFLLLVVWLLWPSPRDGTFDYIRARAAALDHDADRVRAFVENEIAAEPYAGRLRGPVGTLWSGSGSAADRAALLRALLEACGDDGPELTGAAHELTVEFGGESRTYEVGALAGRPLVLRLDEDSAFTFGAVGETQRATGTAEAGGVLRLTHRSGETQRSVRRRFEAEDRDSVHVIVVAAGGVQEWVLDKERELVASRPPDEAAAYLLALTHAAKSDRALRTLERHFELRAHYAEPRLLIGSTHGGDAETVAAHTLDLRRNRVVVTGNPDETTKFHITRSFLEAQLEGAVLREAVANAAVLTSLDVMGEHLERHRASSLHRVSLYRDLIGRLVQQHTGSKLTLGADDVRTLILEHKGGGNVAVASIHDTLTAAMQGAPVPFELLKSGSVATDRHGLLALEIEALLGPAAGGALDYAPTFDLAESTSELIRTDVRFFTYRPVRGEKVPRVTLEYQFTRVTDDGGFEYESIDYWDEIEKKAYRAVGKYSVTRGAVLKSRVISTWYSRWRFGRDDQFLMFSREMMRELKEKGYTTAQYRDRNRKLSEPMKLWLCERGVETLYLNNKPYQVPILKVAGGYAQDDAPKQPYAKVKVIEDPTFKGTPMNKWTVMDDDRFPLVNMRGTRVQTSIPGRVTSTATKLGVPGATIEVAGTGVSGTTAADGRLLLPVIRKPFDVFKVVAKARGYETKVVEIDFRKQDAFPLNLALTPAPDPEAFIRVDANSFAALDQVDDNRLRALVRMSIEDASGSFALVPRNEVPYGPARARAWMLIEPGTLHTSFATSDGLFGVVGNVSKWLDRTPGKVFKELSGVVPGPKDVQGSAVSAYSGYIASWYAYSAGKLQAVTAMMDGHEFKDLGHKHAIGFALQFLKSMEKGMDSFAAKHLGANAKAYKEGFMAGLRFFESHAEYRGK
ncbi:MAG: carboxypeptidase-like regulatory domain-containing protein [Planctomycetota bacterium]|nr:carboxypeptidase-like regulatory domain-containing protein [Planctomycetota bacterium]